MSDLKHVNPPSIRDYGTKATDLFGQIRTSLEALTDDVVTVEYYGPNAVDFKTKAGQLASDLATALIDDLGKISEAVRTSTTNIAQSLGGSPIEVTFDGSPVNPPAVPQGDESSGVNVAAMEDLKGVVTNHMTAIRSHFDTNLSNLQGTDWLGNAKENAVGAVSNFTNSAQGKVDDASQKMQKFITDQLDSTNRADQ